MNALKNSTRWLYQELMRAAPPKVSAWVDYRRPMLRDTWGGPFNGQVQRQEIVRRLVARIQPSQIVETGTFRGCTTEFLSNLSGRSVTSVESDPRYHFYARERLRHHENVELRMGDSRSLLEELAVRVDTKVTTLFYLDAHWYADLPAADEISIISKNWERPVIMIDDFAVSDDSGYTYDDYGDGKVLNLQYLPDSALSGWSEHFPRAHSSIETGAKRGCVVLASPAMRDELASLECLRTASRQELV